MASSTHSGAAAISDPNLETELQIGKSGYSYIDPDVEVGKWENFNQGYDSVMKNMKRASQGLQQLQELFDQMNRLSTADDPNKPTPIAIEKSVYPTDTGKVLKLEFDVRAFSPEDIKVKVKGRLLTITAKQDRDGKYREYTFTDSLPDGVDVGEVTAMFCPEGILIIEAPIHEGIGSVHVKDKSVPHQSLVGSMVTASEKPTQSRSNAAPSTVKSKGSPSTVSKKASKAASHAASKAASHAPSAADPSATSAVSKSKSKNQSKMTTSSKAAPSATSKTTSKMSKK